MPNDLFNSFMTGPDEKGRFGQFGGRFVSETLMPLILELEEQYNIAKTPSKEECFRARQMEEIPQGHPREMEVQEREWRL